MNSIKVLVTLFLMLLLFAQGQCQSGYRACYGFDCKEKKWSFSIFSGFSLLGPARDMYDQMEVSGLGDVRPGYASIVGFIDSKVYPRKRTGLVWNLETGYTISKHSGLSLSAGKSYQSIVEGYQHIGRGNELKLKSALWNISLNYKLRIGKGRGGLNVGPVMAWYSVDAVGPGPFPANSLLDSSFQPGVNVGYTIPIVQKKAWFLTFKVDYTWLPPVEIGPYTVSHTSTYGTNTPMVNTSTFRSSRINLSTINFGLSTGWRF